MCNTRNKANKMKRKQNKKLEVKAATGQRSEHKVSSERGGACEK